ncbi:MAG: aminotransferase class V-fold PLP-dependent enzyme [Rhodothermia bacterium]|nr:MAG: aminotransferase class V-fold PLP-dependent enzyme [Rhodothermia bacterium]
MTDMISCKRDHFSLPDDVHYLNCAYMSPQAKRVEEVGRVGLRLMRNPAEIGPDDFFQTSDEVRRAFADLINADQANRVSLAPAASYGIATAARNLEVPKGSEIVVLFEQFPSNIYTWRRMASERGLKLNQISPPEFSEHRGRIWNERILDSISSATSAVCLPTVHWTDGTRFDLNAIAARAREVDAALIVDGTQSVGAVPFDVQKTRPDCLICAGYKWLLGPYSVGLVYWGERFDEGVPLEENWITRKGSDNFARVVDYQDAYHEGAIRYDVGERSNFILVPMMLEALKFVSELSPSRVQNYCRALTSEMLNEAVQLGYQIESERYRSHHLFGIRVPDGIPFDRLKGALTHHRVTASVRGSAIRISPNVYNNSDDVDALLSSLRMCITESVQ